MSRTEGKAPAWLRNFPAEVAGLDTRRHALIEASAGTGKTFAIEHLVLRLLVENPDWKPEEILLLSFTEKTAAELRTRIRDKLREQLRGGKKLWEWEGREAARIREAWLHCDDLAVHTIHGFCHAALLRDPVANEVLIRPEVVSDRLVADAALENLLRGAWARTPGRLEKFRAALRIGAGEKWRERLIALALAYQPWRGDRIEPLPDPGEVERLENQAAGLCAELVSALRAIDQGTHTKSDYRKSFGETKTGLEKRRKHAFAKVFEAEEKWGGLAPEILSVEILWFFAKGFTKASVAVKHGFASCLPAEAATLAEWVRLADACTGLRNLGPALEGARLRQDLGLRAEAAMELREELGREKQRMGAISYDDMQKDLALAFRKNPARALKLRRRYKACIVDEFQDTDSLQWEILRALCLEESGEDARALPLFLVGDPKQAIYGFRGGDLGTYLKARGELRARAQASPPGAQGMGLMQNFRSRPELVHGLNAVFAHEDWFRAAAEIPEGGAWHLPESSDDVLFTPALPGRVDAPGGPGLWLRDLRGLENRRKPEVEREVRRWIAARIRALVEEPGDFRILEKGASEARPPRFGHIAVLVRKHAEAEALEKVLRARGIPCRVRRRGGVFDGPGADAVRLLLDLIPDAANPEAQSRILLLPFLRREGTDWPRGRPAAFPPLLETWHLLARAGKWPEFFSAVLVDSGYLERLRAVSDSEAERLEALARVLGEAGSAPGTSARALGERFDALRRGEGGDEGAAASGAGEDRADAVTLMTLHLSKGLEFPVVFLAATGEGMKPDFFTLRGTRGFLHVLDKKNPEAAAAHARQSLDEDKRLFYVAFTRAMDRLYVPLLPTSYSGSKPGPLGTFAAQALAALGRDAGNPWVRADEDAVEEKSTVAASGASPGEPADPALPDRETLLRGAREAFAARRRLESFSGLARRAGEAAPASPAADVLLAEDGTRLVREDASEEPEGAGESPPAEKKYPARIAREDLPSGAAAGNALHKLLETMDFTSVLSADSSGAWLERAGQRAAVEEILRAEGLEAAHATAAADAVWNTLRMPLPDPAGGPDFRLAETADRRPELEFLFPFSSPRNPAFLQGFIDLVFRHEGRYYLLDWKSNLLEDYGRAGIAESMRHHRYDLQAQIYAVALDRWLAARVPGYDPALHFGGVYYLYLRGASPERFCGHAHRPSPEDLRLAFPASLEAALGLRVGEGP
jgi:exodeoxyribonuclease V beta subunit